MVGGIFCQGGWFEPAKKFVEIGVVSWNPVRRPSTAFTDQMINKDLTENEGSEWKLPRLVSIGSFPLSAEPSPRFCLGVCSRRRSLIPRGDAMKEKLERSRDRHLWYHHTGGNPSESIHSVLVLLHRKEKTSGGRGIEFPTSNS